MLWSLGFMIACNAKATLISILKKKARQATFSVLGPPSLWVGVSPRGLLGSDFRKRKANNTRKMNNKTKSFGVLSSATVTPHYSIALGGVEREGPSSMP